jgi:hypothetical protein
MNSRLTMWIKSGAFRGCIVGQVTSSNCIRTTHSQTEVYDFCEFGDRTSQRPPYRLVKLRSSSSLHHSPADEVDVVGIDEILRGPARKVVVTHAIAHKILHGS